MKYLRSAKRALLAGLYVRFPKELIPPNTPFYLLKRCFGTYYTLVSLGCFAGLLKGSIWTLLSLSDLGLSY